MQLEDCNDNLMPYGMLLTRFYYYVVKTFPFLQSTLYEHYGHILHDICKHDILSFLDFERVPVDDITEEEPDKDQAESIKEDQD